MKQTLITYILLCIAIVVLCRAYAEQNLITARDPAYAVIVAMVVTCATAALCMFVVVILMTLMGS